MFRNIVSNLPFSPALVGQLGFYAKRLKKEEATRRIGLVFTVLALVMQSFTVFSPPTAVNAASNADFVRGGVSSVGDFLNSYDRNSRDIKELFDSLGITRKEIKNSKPAVIGEKGYYNWSMTSLYSYSQGQRSYKFYTDNGQSKTVFHRPMKHTQQGSADHRYEVYVGHSKKFGWFAIKKDCGNLVTKKRPENEKPPASRCSHLTVNKLSRTKVRLSAKGNAKNGARITSYAFTVKNSSGKVIDTKRVKTSKETASYTYSRNKTGTYKASVVINTSVGKKTDRDCRVKFTINPQTVTPDPVAVCSSLTSNVIARTNLELHGEAAVANGATVSKYTFIVKDSNGNEVAKRVKTTSALTADVAAIALESGTYTVELIVTTSEGDKTNASDCTERITIVPPAVCPVNPSLNANSPECQPCPGNPNLWIKDEQCSADIIMTKSAINLTQEKSVASERVAQASDRIAYTVEVENQGLVTTNAAINEDLQDVLEYAKIIDYGGGDYDDATATLSWPEVELAAGEKQSRTFVVQVKSMIPATNTGTSNQTSYDCTLTNTFGNSVDIPVDCPIEKVVVEQVVSELPQTGPRENMIFAAAVLSIVVYFYARSRQVNKEVRLIRRDLNAGTI